MAREKSWGESIEQAWHKQAPVVFFVVAAISLVYVIYSIHSPPGRPLLTNDSMSYLQFSKIRTSGYPLFLKVLFFFFGVTVEQIPVVQLLLYSFAISILSFQVFLLTGSAIFACCTQVLIFFSPENNAFNFQILSESLFATVTALIVAAAISFLISRRLSALAWLSFLVGLAIAIRPIGVSYLVLLPAILFIDRRRLRGRWLRTLACVALPLVIILIAEDRYYAAHHEGPRRSLGAIVALAKASLVEGPPVWIGKGEQGAAGARLAEALPTEARPIRDLLAQAPNLPAWCRLAYIYETYLEFSFAKAERTAAEAALPSDPDRALYQVAIPRIRQAPSGYAWLSFHHLKCLLTLSLATDAERADFLRFVSAHRPLPFEEEVLDGLKPLYSFPLIVRLGFQVTMAATAVLGVLGIVLVLWGRGAPLSLSLATLLGLVIHTNLMLVAMTAIGHPRYTLGVWIPLVVSMGLLAWFLWQQVAPHVPGGRNPLSTQRHRRGGQQVVAPE